MNNFLIALILSPLLHLIGDYLLQNDWMAQNKTKHWLPCAVHCILYTIPFIIVLGNGYHILIIFGTHYFIDRYRLAVYWIQLVNSTIITPFDKVVPFESANEFKKSKNVYSFLGWYFVFPTSENFGYSLDKPKWMSVWLMIIIDNVFHLTINTLAIILFYV